MKLRSTRLLSFGIATLVILNITACTKTCKEAGNVNYGAGPCQDETTTLLGTYTGTRDSIPFSTTSQDSMTVLVTKVNDGEIQVTVPGMPSFPPVNMELSDVYAAENGWLLSVPTQTNGGQQISGAALFFSSVTDGYFASYTKTLQFCVMISTAPRTAPSYILFKGVHQ